MIASASLFQTICCLDLHNLGRLLLSGKPWKLHVYKEQLCR